MSIQLHFGLPPSWNLRRVSRFVWLLIAISACLPALAQKRPESGPQLAAPGEQDPEAVTNAKPSPGNVTIDGRYVLTVYQQVGTYTPSDRAEKITERLLDLAKDRSIPPESVAVSSREAWDEITAGGKVLLAVTDEDARLAGRPRAELAANDAGNIRQELITYRSEHSWRALAFAILYVSLATALLVVAIWILRRAEFTERRRLSHWIEERKKIDRGRSAWQIGLTYFVSLAIGLGSMIRWLLVIVVFEVYITFVLSCFASTRAISRAITGYLISALTELGQSVLSYLPNLLVIAVVAVVASQIIRFISFIFAQIGNQEVSIRGFYPEWAEPTARLIRLMVLVLVLIVIFPYLPGSKSPAFQGISIFVGVLLSLGSSSAVANMISGVILTYMRSFSVGDWVMIGDTVGEVVERNLLVTRIVTTKQETITIPNATVMGGAVMNYSREAKNAGVIFHTTVTIGYDAPWRTVHQLLLDAAITTKFILKTPKPFVLQTALNDFYVSYELNAYTDTPTEMQFIYSELHENIQDAFNKAGVEICSPHFASLRDGNAITIPEQYRPAGYRAPVFRVDGSHKQKAQTMDKSS